MTIGPCTMLPGHSAVDLSDENGEVVATIYTRDHGFEVVCQRGTAIGDMSLDQESEIERLTVSLKSEPSDTYQG